jgi:hypothetical protein
VAPEALHIIVFFLVGLFAFLQRDKALSILFLTTPFIIEIVQPFVGRTFDWNDIFHDFLGIIMAYCAVRLWDEIYPLRAAIRRTVKKTNN